jgi:antagonist of KipI
MGGSTMGVIIQKPGLLSTIQDLGRKGYQRDGIMVSGAMDLLSMRLANILIGNDESEAVLEVTLIGPSLHFTIDSIISITGGKLSPLLNQIPVSMNKAIFVKKGDKLEFGPLQNGFRSYIAFKGGIKVEKVLESKSTHLSAGFGGLKGRALIKGDILPVVNFNKQLISKINWQLSPIFNRLLFSSEPIRFIKGHQFELFDEESVKSFSSSLFTLTKEANRIGYRFQGPVLRLTKQQEILTEGVTFGSVQVPSNGQPIILMADRQTTGGYPKIAQIISVDLPRLAQLKPGDSISFTEVSLKEAQQLSLDRENEIRAIRKIILEKWKASGL